MNQQAIDAVLGHRELGVVEVVRVDRNAVHQCGKLRRGLSRRADDGRAALKRAQSIQVLHAERAGLRLRAGQRQSEAIENRFFPEFYDVGGDRIVTRIDDELGDVIRQPMDVGK